MLFASIPGVKDATEFALSYPNLAIGVGLGFVLCYFAINTGKLTTSRESTLKAELAKEQEARKALEERVDELEKELEPMRKYIRTKLEEKFSDTGEFQKIK